MDGALFDNTTLAHFKTKYKFLKEVDSVALANVQLNVNQSCAKMFANNKKPKFRAKKSAKRSYITNYVNGNIFIKHVSNTENYIQLPKLGLVKIILHRNIPSDWVLKHVTVKEKASGKFYISLIFTVMLQEVKPLTEFKNVETFDYSMLKLVVSASGKYDVESDDIHWYKKMQDKLAVAQAKLSIMEYGSNNYYKQSHKIGRLHENIVNRRKDYLHKLSFVVAQENDAVGVEDLNMQQMARKFNFGKSVYDNGFGMFRRFLAYKLKGKYL